jgi:hypothetical protein
MGSVDQDFATPSRVGKVRRLAPAGAHIEAISAADSGHELSFLEFRRKVRASELLSAATERLLIDVGFTGRLSIVVQNGRILKSGYEEGYFHRRQDKRLAP